MDKSVSNSDKIAFYVMPESGSSANVPLHFLVECLESGDIQFAGKPMESYEALMAALRPILIQMLKHGIKAEKLPGIETEACMMGSSGAIRDYYEELKAEQTGKG